MSQRPKKMMYCPYCERQVRPKLTTQKRGFFTGLLRSIIKFILYVSSFGLAFFIYRFVMLFYRVPLECPICGAELRSGNYDYIN